MKEREMFEQFTDDSRRVIVFAQEAARELGHAELGTEHLLLGILKVGEPVIEGVGASYEAARDRIEAGAPPAASDPGADLPFSRRAKAAMEIAYRTARRRERQVSPAHLLLGAITDELAAACVVLRALGVDPAEVSLQLVEALGAPPGGPEFLAPLLWHAGQRTGRRVWGVGGLATLDQLGDAALAALLAARGLTRRLGRGTLGPELFAFGLLASGGEAHRALIEAGATEAAARAALYELFSPEQTAAVEAAADGAVALDATMHRVLASADPIGTMALLRRLLEHSAGVWLLLRAAGAEPERLRALAGMDPEGSGSVGVTVS